MHRLGCRRGLVPSSGRDRRPTAAFGRRRRRLERGGAGPPMGCGGPRRQETLRRGPRLERRDLRSRSWSGTLPRMRGECSSAWEFLPHSPPCLTELAVIAHLYAESGSSKAEPLIDQLGNDMPTEAEALRGILAWRQRKRRRGRPAAGGGAGAIAQRSLGAGAYPREDVRRGDRRGQGGPDTGPEAVAGAGPALRRLLCR